MVKSDVVLTQNGQIVAALGEWFEPGTKKVPGRHYPEAKEAIDAFGKDPRRLADLLKKHNTLKLSLYPGVKLAVVVAHAILAEITLGPEPDEFWYGMGAWAAAIKAGVLPQ